MIKIRIRLVTRVIRNGSIMHALIYNKLNTLNYMDKTY